MKKVLIFSGTTEGRELSEHLETVGIPADVCVASQYGQQVMNKSDTVNIHTGRLTPEEMVMLMTEGNYSLCVDATHPFAVEVSENILKSTKEADLNYIRLQRDTKESILYMESSNVHICTSKEECIEKLKNTEGNILLTTGSKELSAFTKNESLRKRLYARVLPAMESLSICYEHGLEGKQILGLQGPFSEDMNCAIMKQYGIKHVVTKETGKNGGFAEKVRAAEKSGAELYIIGNPEKNSGMSFEQVVNHIENIYEKRTLHISLVGIGMGNSDTITVGGKKAIESAEAVFGAKRLIESVNLNSSQKAFEHYLAKDITRELEELLETGSIHRVAVCFSGDSGFFSGCQKLNDELIKWAEKRTETVKIKIYAGISSISYMASATGISWNDSKILSIHGKGGAEVWQRTVTEAVKHNKKTFMLLSGSENFQELSKIFTDCGLGNCAIILGYELSYDNEKILRISPEELANIKDTGLYTCIILNPNPVCKKLTHGRSDDDFIRDKVPMTKEEVREASICKLKLKEGAVIYDIGSGTGSIAVEMAELSETVKVYAIEQKESAVELIKRNSHKFGTSNIVIVQGTAPESLADLPAPTHAFIGGSSGNLKGILNLLKNKNPDVRVVVNAVSMETVAEITDIIKEFPLKDVEVVQLQTSRAKALGRYHLMQAENPVYICSFCFDNEKEE